MANRILLYGATGFSGRLLAAEASRRLAAGTAGGVDVVLGGRDGGALDALSEQHGLEHVVFALDDRARVDAVLREFDVVLNAAGPFAHTAVRLAQCAVATGCHYVDINGEVDVCRVLDDLGHAATTRSVAIVSGAGFTATVSDVMLSRALDLLKEAGWRGDELHVRIAMARMTDVSRGSALTLLRSMREEVMTVRRGAVAHVPVGRLEWTFDFGTVQAPAARPADLPRTDPPAPSPHRIASAANLLDTATAFHTLRRHGEHSAGSIVSYLDLPRPLRAGYQFGALSAVLFQLPLAQRLIGLQLAQLPAGPEVGERQQRRETVLVRVESRFGEPWVDWRMETPNAYDVTASCALAVALRLSTGAVALSGWVTPAEVVSLPGAVSRLSETAPVTLAEEPFVDWTLETRPVFEVVP